MALVLLLAHQQPDGETDIYHLTAGRRYCLGRGSQCQIRVLDLKLSRQHCEFVYLDGRWSLVDLGSTNGCMVDGVRVQEQVMLKEGAVIEAGNSRFIVARIADESMDPEEMLASLVISRPSQPAPSAAAPGRDRDSDELTPHAIQKRPSDPLLPSLVPARTPQSAAASRNTRQASTDFAPLLLEEDAPTVPDDAPAEAAASGIAIEQPASPPAAKVPPAASPRQSAATAAPSSAADAGPAAAGPQRRRSSPLKPVILQPLMSGGDAEPPAPAASPAAPAVSAAASEASDAARRPSEGQAPQAPPALPALEPAPSTDAAAAKRRRSSPLKPVILTPLASGGDAASAEEAQGTRPCVTPAARGEAPSEPVPSARAAGAGRGEREAASGPSSAAAPAPPHPEARAAASAPAAPEAAPLSRPAPASERPPAAPGAMGVSAPQPPAEVAQPPAARSDGGAARSYYVTVLGQRIGPLTQEQARDLKARELRGQLSAAELAALMKPAPPPAPPPASEPPRSAEAAGIFITVLGQRVGPLTREQARDLKARELRGQLTPADIAPFLAR